MRKLTLATVGSVILLASCLSMGNPHASSTKIYVQQKNTEKAMAEAQAWAQDEPDNPAPYLWMGVIKANEEDWSTSADYFIKALTMDPSLREEGKLAKELSIAGAPVFDKKRVYTVILNAGIDNFNKKNYDAAEKYLKFAAELEPTEAQPWMLLVSLYEQTNRSDDAKAALAKAEEVDPNNAQVKLHLALYAENDGDLDKAEKYLLEAIKLDTAYAEAYQELGTVYYQRAKEIEAKGDTAKALELYGKAKENFQRAMSIKPELTEAYLNLGIACVKLEEYEEAIKALEAYVKDHPDDFNGWFLLAGSYLEMKTEEEVLKGLDAIEKAIAIKPDSYEAWELKGQIYRKLSKLAKKAKDRRRYKNESLKAYKKAMKLKAKQGK